MAGAAQFPPFVQKALAKSAKGKRPGAPTVTDKDIEGLEKRIGGLGEEQVAGLKKLEKEQQRWYNKKMQKLVDVLNED